MGSDDDRERGSGFQVNIFSGNFWVNKSWIMPLSCCENVSLAIVLELQTELGKDEVTYSTETRKKICHFFFLLQFMYYKEAESVVCLSGPMSIPVLEYWQIHHHLKYNYLSYFNGYIFTV